MINSTEFEGRILEVDVDKVVKKLEKMNAVMLGEQVFKRYVFETIPIQKGKWIRLRTDGQKSTLALKHIVSNEIDGTNEWEVEVSNFENTFTILQKSGIIHRSYQENKRIPYRLSSGSEVSIDFWPKIPPYLEIEASNKKEVEDIAAELGFSKESLVGINTDKIYYSYGIDISQVKELTFNDKR